MTSLCLWSHSAPAEGTRSENGKSINIVGSKSLRTLIKWFLPLS